MGRKDNTTVNISNSKLDVALISMPFFTLNVPAMGPSMLKAGLTEAGISSKVFYFGFLFAKMVGQERFQHMLQDTLHLPDWVFTRALFGDRSRAIEEVLQDIEKYLENYSMNLGVARSEVNDFLSSRYLKTQIKSARLMESKAEQFLGKCLKDILRHQPRIVGFSSTFHQHIASLALAKRIKEMAPETYLVFGGANCRGIMGIEMVKQFSFVDAVFLGEADEVFPEMVKRIMRKDSLSDLPGVYTRMNTISVPADGRYSAAWVRNLDKLPYPDFDDYFELIKSTPKKLLHNPQLVCETSRGCWWGKCLFCGNDHANTAYRSKSTNRALDEIEYLSKKYPARQVIIVDDVLDMKLFKDFFPSLASRKLGIEFHCEVKTSLKKDHVKALSAAGVRSVLPGIESFSTPLLKLMQKGVTSLQNIQILKWCREMGVKPHWNILWGFPAEPVEEYQRMAKLIQFLVHLSPPMAIHVHIIRFSIYYDNAEHFCLKNIRPSPIYKYIYPFDDRTIANLANIFIYDAETNNDEVYAIPLQEAIDRWNEVYSRNYLCSFDDGERLFVWDERPAAAERLTVFTDIERLVYAECDAATDIKELRRKIEDYTGDKWKKKDVEKIMEPMIEAGLMYREDDKYLSLAVHSSAAYPPAEVKQRFEKYVVELKEKKKQKELLGKVTLTELPKGKKVVTAEIKRVKRIRKKQ